MISTIIIKMGQCMSQRSPSEPNFSVGGTPTINSINSFAVNTTESPSTKLWSYTNVFNDLFGGSSKFTYQVLGSWILQRLWNERKLKQWWWTIPPISKYRTLEILSNHWTQERASRHVVGNPGIGTKRIVVKQVKRITNLPSRSLTPKK